MKKIRLILLLILIMSLISIYQFNIAYGQSRVGFFIKILDTFPPVLNITKPAPTSSVSINLTGTYSEDDVLANITVVLNGSYKVNSTFNTTSRTWRAAVNLTEGWNKFYVLAYDASGNFANVTSSSQGASVLLDTTKPSINLTSPLNGSSVANNSLISFKISDFGLADTFYTINSGATTSFNSVYDIQSGTSDWVNGANYIIVNATDFTNNVQRKNFTFMFTNSYAVVLNNSIITAISVINDTNKTVNNLQNSSNLQSIVNNFAAVIPVNDYNNTIQVLNVVANLSTAVNSIQSLLQSILTANSSNQNNTNTTNTINSKLDEIISIRNTTVSAIDVNLFNSNVTIATDNTTKNNVTNQIIATVAGLSASDQQSFRDASEALQNKTTIINKVQTLTQTFLNGRTENITLFEKNITLNETQSGKFYVNEFIDKNITGNNDLNANTDVTNRASQSMSVVVADPTVSWSFNNAAEAVISYTVDKNVPSDKILASQTVVTTVPTSTNGGGSVGTSSTSSGGSSGTSSGGKGGGGVFSPVSTNFSIDKTILKVVLKQGQITTKTLKIKNTGTSIFDIKAYLQDLGRFKMLPQENELTTRLSPNEEKMIELTFKALEDEKPDIYPAKITFKSPSIQTDIDTVIEVDSAQPLFDADVEVLPDSKKVFPGDNVLIEVNLFNIRGFGRVDVNVEYQIKDFKGNVVASEHETVAVETQAKFSRALLVPSDLRPGTYVALAKVTYGDSVGTSSDLFEVEAKTIKLFPIQIQDYRFVIAFAVAVALIVVIVFTYRFAFANKKDPGGKTEEIETLREEDKSQKLKKELAALEKAQKAGFISEESFQKEKKRIEEMLSKFK